VLLYGEIRKTRLIVEVSMKRLTRREMLKAAAGAGLMGMSPLIMSGCGGASAGVPEAAGIVLWVPFGPTAVRQEGQVAFGYELYIGRVLSLGLTVATIQVLRDGPAGDVIKTYEGEELAKCLFNKVTPFSADDAIFTGRDYAVLLAWPSVDASGPIPATLYHRVYFSNGAVASGGVAPVSTKATLISPPVTGNGWFANFGPSNFDTHHRRSITVMQMEGNAPRISISQRFATDWMKLGPDGLLLKKPGTSNTDFYCYNADVLAVATGTVINVLDGIPEGPPLSHPVPITSQNAFGNSVVIEFGDGRYGVYCHLIPGSVSVKANDKVTQGQVIGKLGNSGNTDCPHLHFHVCNAEEPLFSEGLPFSFASYELQGTYTNVEEPWTPSGPPERRTLEMPACNQVVNLP
jgi:murein DD-endopeptidase